MGAKEKGDIKGDVKLRFIRKSCRYFMDSSEMFKYCAAICELSAESGEKGFLKGERMLMVLMKSQENRYGNL